MRDKVTRQCAQTTTLKERRERKQDLNREVLLLTGLTNALPLGQAGTLILTLNE